MAKTKAEKARVWVDGYAIGGAALVIAAVVPGATSAALVLIEGTMCFQIGRIYKGDGFSVGDGLATAGVVGLAAVAGKLAALEALNLIPGAGWIVKAPIAGAVIKGLGEAIIFHFERAED